MPVYECCGCIKGACTLILQDPDCLEPTICQSYVDTIPVWRELKEAE